MSRTHVETIGHAIGEDGSLSLKLVSGTVRIVGVDGGDARVQVRVQLHDGQGPGEVIEVTRVEGELRVEVGGGGRGGLATFLTRSLSDADLEVQCPRAATLRLSGVSADLEVRGVEGDQEYRTVSGDLSIEAGSGAVTVQSVSGDVRIQGTRLAVEATSTSGDIEIAAGQMERLRLRSVSGDVSLAGALQAGSEHRFESVSGDLRIEPHTGIALTMSGFSGGAHSELPYREESRGGRRVLVIGDGAADITFRSMSGDAEIVAPAGTDAGPRERHRIDLSRRDRTRAEREAADSERDRLRAERDAIREQTHAAREMARDAGQAARDHARVQARRVRSQARAFRRGRRDTASSQLDVLRALERGEIDVDEATRLLEGTEGA